MDLLAATSRETDSAPMIRRGFKSLKLLNVQLEDKLSEEPVGVHYGALTNGLHYYVRRNTKPRMRAAVALAVKVGFGGGGGKRGCSYS